MSTIVNNPAPTERTVVETDSSGWAIAVIILLLIIGGGIYYWMHHRAAAPAQQPPVIQVTIPAGSGAQPSATQ